MSNLRNNIQLPVVFLGALMAIIMEQVIQLIFFVPVQDYVQGKAEFYQEKLASGKEISWFAENYVVNGALSNILILAAVTIFAAAFYYFVVRVRSADICDSDDCDVEKCDIDKKDNNNPTVVISEAKAASSKSVPAKKTTAKKKPVAKKATAKKTTKK
ncbi:hypothetical protein KA529_00765 [Candidatus Saccharibacteria bacterium]|nr:hypothetical protein [Candidatus Saccharibacteria bacterium]